MTDQSVTKAIDSIISEHNGKFVSSVKKMKWGQIYIPPGSKNICVEGEEFEFPTREEMEACATSLLDDKRTKRKMYLIG
jgi:hypothetical protein